MESDLINVIPLDLKDDAIIKVMGVGGGGCNAVNYMHRQGIHDVTFLVCNTDRQALGKSSVPAKLQLGPGLGAGGDPERAQGYAEESRDRIREALDDGTQMLFLTAGMGGGTGTGASSIVAEVAQEMGILTVGIVTIPFAFEGKRKIRKAMQGVARLAEHVDALLVINNEKLKQIYSDLNLLNAFSKSDDVVCNAAKSIAEIITVPGYINTDFADVRNTLRNGGVAIMNVGQAKGENRITKAIDDALQSPLVNTSDVHGAKRILLQFYCSTEHAIVMNEIDQINEFVKEVGDDVEVQWGASLDETLGENVRVTIIATGYEVSDIPTLDDASLDEAVISQYQEPKPAPKEDEKPQEVDLTGVVQDEAPAAPAEEHQRVSGEDPDMIVIDVEEDSAIVEPKKDEAATEAKPKRPFWLRGR
ncbi:MAG: cell division protein FtsZ [Paludibacteraceae bacterium]|nr:cell division protein FtsZ [Paludibacteraceae bacterium]MBP5642587.1 cell division protein FtsZ [Paludibacteraceae bacterium]MBQ4391222.1 cell division protein FtsZ [Paludibacteraceae bacterium]MBQ4391372.1 cell division protein FtsZ [Paludibacteraceae bacterium]